MEIRDTEISDEYFVGTCTHVGESEEIDACARRRISWLRSMQETGLGVKVAIHGGKQVGFLYVIPIEVCPWGPLGRDLLVVPCLVVLKEARGKAFGRALILEAEEEAKRQGCKGIVTVGYYHDFWVMKPRERALGKPYLKR